MRRIYVIDSSGTIIGCYPEEERAELVGSLVHALSMFSKEVLKMEISEVKMGYYYMIMGKTKQDLMVVVISPVREKRTLERAINELNVSFRDVEITPGRVAEDITKIAIESIKRAFEKVPPLDIIDKVLNYAWEMPRRAPPSWVSHYREHIKKVSMKFERKVQKALKENKIDKHYLRLSINRLLARDFIGAWKAALKSGSKTAILHTSISLVRVDPRIDGTFLRKCINCVDDNTIRRYIELRYKSFIDLDPRYDETLREIMELGKKLVDRAETDDECLILYLPPSTARPRRLEEILPLEEKLLHNFYSRFIKLRSEVEDFRESFEAYRKFAELCKEFYMDIAKNISYRSPTYLLLMANTIKSILATIELSECPRALAREFLERISPFMENIVRCIKHNAWKRVSIHTLITLFSSIIELGVMCEDEKVRSKIMNILNKAREMLLKTIAYTILKERINIFILEDLLLLTTLSPLLEDKELISILYFSHPIISRDCLKNLMLNRPELGLEISTFLHIGSLIYQRLCLNKEIKRSAIEIAELGMEEIERRIGEEGTRTIKWLLNKLRSD